MEKDLSLCLMNDSFPPLIDGVANAVVNYASVVQRKYGRAAVAVPYYPEVTDDYPFEVIRYRSLKTPAGIGYRAGDPFELKTIKQLTAMNFDIIHSHCPAASTLLARTLRASADLPVVFTYHTKFDIDIKRILELKLLQEAAIRAMIENIEACDEVWVVSRGAGENLRSLGYRGDYIVMDNGVDFERGRSSDERIASLKKSLAIGDEAVFLFVGRMMWYKGIRIILDALKKAKDDGVKFTMLFVGDGADRLEIEEYSRSLGLTECRFVGALHDRELLRDHYSAADMFLFPSTFDTNGIVVREAAACGCASVLVRGSCAAEGIADGRNGVFIDENADSLASVVTALSKDRAKMKTLGENAMNEIYMSWEDSIARAVERYGIVIDNYRSGAKNNSELKLPDRFFESMADSEKALDALRRRAKDELESARNELAERSHRAIEYIKSIGSADDDRYL